MGGGNFLLLKSQRAPSNRFLELKEKKYLAALRLSGSIRDLHYMKSDLSLQCTKPSIGAAAQ